MRNSNTTDALVAGIQAGDRALLGRALTLVESNAPEDRRRAQQLLSAILPFSGAAHRVGITGVPGVGKSTFIEAFGLRLLEHDHRVAVLAVDPSSSVSKGSILGDKTRMEQLARDPGAFIRPSPSQTHLGGVARRTREAVALCEAAGYDIVLIETVGVGQSETVVDEISDLFILLLAPAGGDELQGVKRGIMEMADLIIVNKADGDLKPAATRTCSDYAGALRLLRKRPQDPPGYPKAMMVSAMEQSGLADAWSEMQTLANWRRENGHWDKRRAQQARYWFVQELRLALLARLEDPEVQDQIEALGTQVADGILGPSLAAQKLLAGLDRG